jgi:hypothetical protein
MGVGCALMKKEDAQVILKIIKMRDMLVDARRCKDMRDEGLTGRDIVTS